MQDKSTRLQSETKKFDNLVIFDTTGVLQWCDHVNKIQTMNGKMTENAIQMTTYGRDKKTGISTNMAKVYKKHGEYGLGRRIPE